MSRTALTLRIDTAERNALRNLSKIEGRPVNQLLIEAIHSYLGQKGQKERSLEASLHSLKAYRRKDPGFRRAMAAFVEAEATVNDPLEGEAIEDNPENLVDATGPIQGKIRGLIGAELGRR